MTSKISDGHGTSPLLVLPYEIRERIYDYLTDFGLTNNIWPEHKRRLTPLQVLPNDKYTRQLLPGTACADGWQAIEHLAQAHRQFYVELERRVPTVAAVTDFDFSRSAGWDDTTSATHSNPLFPALTYGSTFRPPVVHAAYALQQMLRHTLRYMTLKLPDTVTDTFKSFFRWHALRLEMLTLVWDGPPEKNARLEASMKHAWVLGVIFAPAERMGIEVRYSGSPKVCTPRSKSLNDVGREFRDCVQGCTQKSLDRERYLEEDLGINGSDQGELYRHKRIFRVSLKDFEDLRHCPEDIYEAERYWISDADSDL